MLTRLSLTDSVPQANADKDWFAAGQRELQDALNVAPNTNVAKNVILFLGEFPPYQGRVYLKYARESLV